MTSRRVGRPCAITPKAMKIKIKKEPKTVKIKIKKEPKKVKIKIKKEPKKVKIKIKKEPKMVKIKIVKRKPPALPPKPKVMSEMAKARMRELEKVRLLNSNNRVEKDNIKSAKKEAILKKRADMISANNKQKVLNFKERAKMVSANNRKKVAIRRKELATKRQAQDVLAADKKQAEDELSRLRLDFEIKTTNKKKADKKAEILMKKQIEKEIEIEEAKVLSNMRSNLKIKREYRKTFLTKTKSGTFADKARGI